MKKCKVIFKITFSKRANEAEWQHANSFEDSYENCSDLRRKERRARYSPLTAGSIIKEIYFEYYDAQPVYIGKRRAWLKGKR